MRSGEKSAVVSEECVQNSQRFSRRRPGFMCPPQYETGSPLVSDPIDFDQEKQRCLPTTLGLLSSSSSPSSFPTFWRGGSWPPLRTGRSRPTPTAGVETGEESQYDGEEGMACGGMSAAHVQRANGGQRGVCGQDRQGGAPRAVARVQSGTEAQRRVEGV